jgi:hypothetical protein
MDVSRYALVAPVDRHCVFLCRCVVMATGVDRRACASIYREACVPSEIGGLSGTSFLGDRYQFACRHKGYTGRVSALPIRTLSHTTVYVDLLIRLDAAHHLLSLDTIRT